MEEIMPVFNCIDCYAYDVKHKECHRHAPKNTFPKVDAHSDWCVEFIHKDPDMRLAQKANTKCGCK